MAKMVCRFAMEAVESSRANVLDVQLGQTPQGASRAQHPVALSCPFRKSPRTPYHPDA